MQQNTSYILSFLIINVEFQNKEYRTVTMSTEKHIGWLLRICKTAFPFLNSSQSKVYPSVISAQKPNLSDLERRGKLIEKDMLDKLLIH